MFRFLWGGSREVQNQGWSWATDEVAYDRIVNRILRGELHPATREREVGRSLLALAAWHGDFETTKLVADAVHTAQGIDDVAVIYAAWQGQLSVLDYLITLHGDVNAKERDGHSGKSAVMLAAGRGHTHIIEYLAEHGADLNATSAPGGVALTLAAERDDLQVVETLLRFGAAVDGGHPTPYSSSRSRAAEPSRDTQVSLAPWGGPQLVELDAVV